MKRISFTASVIEKTQCDPEKKQTIFHDAKTPGLGLRVTDTGSKSYVFESKLHGKTIRITIGSPQAWPLKKAQTEAARLNSTLSDYSRALFCLTEDCFAVDLF